MAPYTRSKSGAVPSGAHKRAAETYDESQSGASSASTQQRPGTRKRVKVSQDEAEVNTSKPTVRAPRQKVRGLLKALPDMPLDVLEEIFIICDPETLVSVLRTNKAFCRLLQSSAYGHVWREAFARIPDIPSAPEDWSLVKWAGLLFGERCCQSCLCPKVDVISFFILKRLCEQCIRTSMTECIEGVMPMPRGLYPRYSISIIPTASIYEEIIPRSRLGITRIQERIFAYQSDLDTLASGIQNAIESEDKDGRVYLTEKQKLFRPRKEHATIAEQWYKTKLLREAKLIADARAARKEELKDAKKERHNEIMRRIRLAGYDSPNDIAGIRRLKGVKVSQPLTEDDWDQLWPTIEPLVKANKEKRLAERSEARLKERFESAQYRFWGHWERLPLTQRERSFWPSMEQLPHFEPMASFVQLDAELDDYGRLKEGWYDTLKELYEPTLETIRRIMHEHDLDLARKIAGSHTVDDHDRILGLATSVLVLGKSKTSPPNFVYVYFGREVLQAARSHATWLEDHPFSDPLPATFSELGSAAVRKVLHLCKLTSSTTILELDTLDPHFVCTTCEPTSLAYWVPKVQIRHVLSWRTAVEHACRVHGADSSPMGLRLLDNDEYAVLSAKSYKKLAGYSSFDIKHVAPDCFRCNHCKWDLSEIPQNRRRAKCRDGVLTLKEILKHLQLRHLITPGAAKENVDYWYYPRMRRGLLRSRMSEFRLIV